MPDLFALAMPWWEFILRAVVVYVVVLGMVRLSGKRPLGQITPFDVLLVVLLGNAVQNALLGTDTSLGGGLLLLLLGFAAGSGLALGFLALVVAAGGILLGGDLLGCVGFLGALLGQALLFLLELGADREQSQPEGHLLP